MKRLNKSRALLIATLSSVTLVTFSQVTFAATVGGGESSNAKRMKAAVTHAAAPPSEKGAIANPPLTLVIEAPNGNTFRLIRLPDAGWKFVDRASGTKTTEASLTPTTPQPEESSAVDDPLTVFIDGPTGFTYVWMRDKGWKFVGRVAD